MARKPRQSDIGIPLHVIQRGNNKTKCFLESMDFATYINWLRKYKEKYDVSIHAWALMNNHVHLLCTPQKNSAVSKMMQFLGTRYVRYFNTKYGRTGTLWEGRFKSFPVYSDLYLLTLYRYIERNPVAAGIVNTPEEYEWTSYKSNALGFKSKLITPHQKYLELDNVDNERRQKYQELFADTICQEKLRALGIKPGEIGITPD
ncbi:MULTISPECIES: transposase [Gammaproteobacteria]|uniref:transposase n=1 Tax=Gammaproteobacteria TaxID=1236 RepID=UPI001A9D8FAE|nr:MULTISPECIES: transposase [Gammaproteobacteria]